MSRTTSSLATIIATILCAGAPAASLLTAQQATPPPAPKTLSTPPPAGQQTLPGGASQIQETHGDWRVICAPKDSQKVCTVSQQQTDANSRQLVLGIELKPTAFNKAEGTIVLPFGLAVTKPVTLQVDEAGLTQTAEFRTCLPVGCLVALTLEPSIVASLRQGTALTVKAIGEGDNAATFKISLKGFSSAFDRTAALAK